MSDEKELRRRIEALRLRHNESNDMSIAHGCLFADLIAAVEILARYVLRAHGEATITDPSKPTKPAIPLCVCKRTPDRHIQTAKGDGWLDCDGVVRLYR